jgi:hypothetical protein
MSYPADLNGLILPDAVTRSLQFPKSPLMSCPRAVNAATTQFVMTEFQIILAPVAQFAPRKIAKKNCQKKLPDIKMAITANSLYCRNRVEIAL